jgi:hypothetical protein
VSVWNRNRLTSKPGIDYVIIQGPLGGLSSQRWTAAVSNFGGLGSLGAHGLSPAAIKDVIAEIRSLTSRPLAMNLWVSMEDVRSFEVACAEPRREQSHMQFEWKLQLRHFSGEVVIPPSEMDAFVNTGRQGGTYFPQAYFPGPVSGSPTSP